MWVLHSQSFYFLILMQDIILRCISSPQSIFFSFSFLLTINWLLTSYNLHLISENIFGNVSISYSQSDFILFDWDVRSTSHHLILLSSKYICFKLVANQPNLHHLLLLSCMMCSQIMRGFQPLFFHYLLLVRPLSICWFW